MKPNPKIELEMVIIGGPLDGEIAIMELEPEKWESIKGKIAKWEVKGHVYRLVATPMPYTFEAHFT